MADVNTRTLAECGFVDGMSVLLWNGRDINGVPVAASVTDVDRPVVVHVTLHG